MVFHGKKICRKNELWRIICHNYVPCAEFSAQGHRPHGLSAGVSRIQFAPNAREIKVMYSSRLHPGFITRAYLEGLDGVMIYGCHLGDCHYMAANEQTEKTVENTRKALLFMGLNPDRLRREYISASESVKYAEAVNGFAGFLAELGPLEVNEAQKAELENFKKPKQRKTGLSPSFSKVS